VGVSPFSWLITDETRMLDHRATLPIQHGGNQSAIRKRLKLGSQTLLDFSAPLNALGPPPGAVAAVRTATESIDRYPEPGSPRLVERLAEYHRVPTDRIIIGAGTTELICLIGQVLRDTLIRRARELGEPEMPLVHLVEPSYGEYRRTSAQNGLRTKVWDDHILGWGQEVLPEGDAIGIFWTGHPNNPTGRAWDRDRLLSLVDRSPSLLVVVDEAYLAFLPDEAERTLVRAAATRNNLVVLRSMTKIYSFPGLRIGYAVAAPDMVTRLRRCQQPWTVATSAELAALVALDDDDYLARTIDLISTESARLTDRLWDLPGIRPVWPGRDRPKSAPPPPNFVLVSLVDTPWTSVQAQEALAHRGLFVRECSNYCGLEVGGILTGHGLEIETRGHLRVCVRTPAENDLLVETLAKILASRPPA
jgi:threonine-phosphate decarboxylase